MALPACLPEERKATFFCNRPLLPRVLELIQPLLSTRTSRATHKGAAAWVPSCARNAEDPQSRAIPGSALQCLGPCWWQLGLSRQSLLMFCARGWGVGDLRNRIPDWEGRGPAGHTQKAGLGAGREWLPFPDGPTTHFILTLYYGYSQTYTIV